MAEDMRRDEESLMGEDVIVEEKETFTQSAARRIIAVVCVVALGALAYTNASPLTNISTNTAAIQFASEETSVDIPTPEISSMTIEQAMFGGLDENQDSSVSKEEFTKFMKGENKDPGLEGFRSMKFEEIDIDKDGIFYEKDFTNYLQTTKDAKVSAALKALKAQK